LNPLLKVSGKTSKRYEFMNINRTYDWVHAQTQRAVGAEVVRAGVGLAFASEVTINPRAHRADTRGVIGFMIDD
jgi:hypothetical protein